VDGARTCWSRAGRTATTSPPRFAGYVGIYNFAGARDEGNAKLVDAAVQRGDMATVKSLRSDPHAREESCWLHGKGCACRAGPQ